MGKKSRGRKPIKSTNAGSNSNERATMGDFRSHEAFDAVLRQHCHPAAAADLDALPRGGPSWRRYLEALGTTCRDNAIQLKVEDEMKENHQGAPPTKHVDESCLILRAFVDMGEKMRAGYGPRYASLLTENSCQKMKDNLKNYGRPIASKKQMLEEHEFRVYHHAIDTKREQAQGMMSLRNTSSSVKKEVNPHQSSGIDWAGLQKISIRNIKLYDSNEGVYIEGKLLVDPFTPAVGTTTILEDANGDVLLLALYNFLPDGLQGDDATAIASTKIPKGCTIRIAAPFMKVFRDGSRGVRVDEPNDILVVSSGSAAANVNEVDAVAQAKKLGNSLVQKKMYNAAIDAYINGLRKASLVPTLLSNRSQAHAMLGEWEHSFADAAASLVIRPGDKKTWSRYKKALNALECDENEEDTRVKASLIIKRVLKNGAEGDEERANLSENKNASELKSEGNKSFQSKDYCRAVSCYSAALKVCGEETRALLANWSLCCLQTRANLDAVAAAAASLRIRPEAKALVRLARGMITLGEPEMARDILNGKFAPILETGGSAIQKDNNELSRCAATAIGLKSSGSRELLTFLQQSQKPKYMSQWVGNIEVYDAGSKGRGVRACCDLQPGQVVLVEPPIASAETGGDGYGTKDLMMSIGSKKVRQSDAEYLRNEIILRSQREGVLSKIVDCLYDGTNKRPVTPMEQLIPNIALCPILLPSHHEYLSEGKIQLTAERVQAIQDTNAHGTGGLSVKSIEKGLTSSLYPALSMFNHSSSPTCVFDEKVDDYAAIVMVTRVKAGGELTMRYHLDEDVARRAWGIST